MHRQRKRHPGVWNSHTYSTAWIQSERRVKYYHCTHTFCMIGFFIYYYFYLGFYKYWAFLFIC